MRLHPYAVLRLLTEGQRLNDGQTWLRSPCKAFFHAATFASKDIEACAGLVEGRRIYFTETSPNDACIRCLNIFSAVLPLKQIIFKAGYLCSKAAMSFVLAVLRSIAASMLPGRMQLSSTSHKAIFAHCRASIRDR